MDNAGFNKYPEMNTTMDRYKAKIKSFAFFVERDFVYNSDSQQVYRSITDSGSDTGRTLHRFGGRDGEVISNNTIHRAKNLSNVQ